MDKLTPKQKAILQDCLNRMNARRRAKNYAPVAYVPPPARGDLRDFYLVDTYQVRRHWRRRPQRS